MQWEVEEMDNIQAEGDNKRVRVFIWGTRTCLRWPQRAQNRMGPLAAGSCHQPASLPLSPLVYLLERKSERYFGVINTEQNDSKIDE